jgi:hypothetical protein
VVGCAGRAATGTQMAGWSDVADLPPMRKLLVPPGGLRSGL